MTYFRERVMGNWKPTATEKQKAKIAKPRVKREEREGNDDKHLSAIRQCVCTVCNRVGGNDCHHLKDGTGERGAGMRSSDRWAVPLCREHHMELEREGSRNERRWFEKHGIDAPLDLAAALWSASPSVPAMMKILIAHKRGK